MGKKIGITGNEQKGLLTDISEIKSPTPLHRLKINR